MQVPEHSFCTRLSEMPHFFAASGAEINSNISVLLFSNLNSFFPNKSAGKNTQQRQLDALLDGISNMRIGIVTATVKEIVEIENEDNLCNLVLYPFCADTVKSITQKRIDVTLYALMMSKTYAFISKPL